MSFEPQIFQTENNSLIDSLLQRQDSVMEELSELERSVADCVSLLAAHRESGEAERIASKHQPHESEILNLEISKGGNSDSTLSRAA